MTCVLDSPVFKRTEKILKNDNHVIFLIFRDFSSDTNQDWPVVIPFILFLWRSVDRAYKAPSTLICLRTKTELLLRFQKDLRAHSFSPVHTATPYPF